MNNFQNLINKEKYQVFVFSCPASIPVNFAVHTWFVVNKKGEVSRYEILHKKNLTSNNLGFSNIGYWYKNALPDFSGISIFMTTKKYWKGKLLGLIEGEEALKIIECIENSYKEYPYTKTYSTLGPNSNTYTNWILKKFPNFKIKLPWNAIGGNYK